jgi:DNA-binding XRE family transcriptional regulator
LENMCELTPANFRNGSHNNGLDVSLSITDSHIRYFVKGSELRQCRTRLSLTQPEIASLLGLHRNSVARMERGQMAITASLGRFVRLLMRQAERQSLRSLLRIMEEE